MFEPPVMVSPSVVLGLRRGTGIVVPCEQTCYFHCSENNRLNLVCSTPISSATKGNHAKRPRSLLICGLVSLAYASLGSAGEPRVFDREIAAQPFDKEPFRQIAIPEWVEDTLGCGYTLSGMNFEQRKGRSLAWRYAQ